MTRAGNATAVITTGTRLAWDGETWAVTGTSLRATDIFTGFLHADAYGTHAGAATRHLLPQHSPFAGCVLASITRASFPLSVLHH